MFILLLKTMPFLAVLALPLIEAGGVAYYLRGSLSRPWLFALSAVFAVYVMLGYFAYRDFTTIGLSGNPSNEQPQSVFLSGGIVAIYLLLAFAVIWGTSYLFRRST
jgi:hypothetical protein